MVESRGAEQLGPSVVLSLGMVTQVLCLDIRVSAKVLPGLAVTEQK